MSKDDKKTNDPVATPDTNAVATPDPAEEAKKAAEAIIAEAKKEAEKIKADAIADAKKTAAASEVVDDPSDPKRPVKIKLFKDNQHYKDPVFVGLNDYTAQIERGVWVTVPYYVAAHIREMEEQDRNTAEMIDMYTADFERKKEKLL